MTRELRSFNAKLEEIAGPERLLSAWRSYAASKRRRPAVARFALDAERRLLDLSDDVLAGTYSHGPYRLLEIRDPKARLIAVASVGDRVLHRSIYDVLSPRYDRSFILDSYACLPGRGSHRAILRFLEMQRTHGRLMHLDIRTYFPSVDHEILLSLLTTRLRDRRVASLLETILESGDKLYRRPAMRSFYPSIEPRGDRPRGLPIGNLTSQWWGNLYLDGFDHFVKHELQVEGYLRYMDDLVFFADQSIRLRRWRRDVGDWLWENRRLRLNQRKAHIRSTQLTHNYLGYEVTRQGFDLGPKAIRRFRRQLPGLLRGDLERLGRTLASWNGAMRF